MICAVFFILYLQFENHVLGPLIVGRSVKLSPPATMTAALIGVSAGGVVGALVAVPVVASVKVVYLELRQPPPEPDLARFTDATSEITHERREEDVPDPDAPPPAPCARTPPGNSPAAPPRRLARPSGPVGPRFRLMGDGPTPPVRSPTCVGGP